MFGNISFPNMNLKRMQVLQGFRLKNLTTCADNEAAASSKNFRTALLFLKIFRKRFSEHIDFIIKTLKMISIQFFRKLNIPDAYSID